MAWGSVLPFHNLSSVGTMAYLFYRAPSQEALHRLMRVGCFLAALLWAAPAMAQSPSPVQDVTPPPLQAAARQSPHVQEAALAPTETVWKVVGGDCDHQILVHRRAQDPGNSQPLEQLKLLANNGTHIHAATVVARTPVIEELEIELPLRSNRNGLQLLARVVLPRAIDPNTNGPVTVLVGGELYQDIGNWQILHLRHLPKRLERRVRVLRHAMDLSIDTREAFVDLVVVNAYGGPGMTEVWFSSPLLDGQPQQSTFPQQQQLVTRQQPQNTIQRTQFMNNEIGPVVEVLEPAQTVELTGDLLSIEGRPLYARIIDHQGEDFAFLAQVGFNTIRLIEPATADQLFQAARLGLWLICPPPDLALDGPVATDYSRVLAWDLGDELGSRDLTSAAQLAATVRKKQDLPRRPIVGAPMSQLTAYSRHLDIVLHTREPVGTSLDMGAFARWLAQRPQLCRPSVLHWATVQTEVLPTLVRQWRAFGFHDLDHLSVESQQIRQLAYIAAGAGMRGLHFRSRSRLDDPGQIERTETLRLLNLELETAEPWIAAGKQSTHATSGDPDILAPILRTDRAQLMVVTRSASDDQYVSHPADETELLLTIPGVPVGCSAYQVGYGGFSNLSASRVAGGLRVPIANDSLPALVVITRDPLVINSLSVLLRSQAQELTYLKHRAAEFQTARCRQILEKLAIYGNSDPSALELVEAAQERLQQASLRAPSGAQSPTARRSAREALALVSHVRHQAWEQAAGGFLQPIASPMCTQFTTLPWHRKLAQSLPTAQRRVNTLPSGKCEDLVVMQHRGWVTLEHSPQDIITQVTLMPEESGNNYLRLTAAGQTENANNSVVPAPLVWVNSPAMAVVPGQLFKISGRIHVPTPIRGSEDGFLVFDSLGGPQLAYRIQATRGWSNFVMYRAAAENQDRLQITFALAGLGEAWVDDLTISPILKHGTNPRTAKLDQPDATESVVP